MKGGCECRGDERTCTKIQYEPYLISVACSYTELSICRKFGRIGQGDFPENAKKFEKGSLRIVNESTVFFL